jgi:hypothetical protein
MRKMFGAAAATAVCLLIFGGATAMAANPKLLVCKGTAGWYFNHSVWQFSTSFIQGQAVLVPPVGTTIPPVGPLGGRSVSTPGLTLVIPGAPECWTVSPTTVPSVTPPSQTLLDPSNTLNFLNIAAACVQDAVSRNTPNDLTNCAEDLILAVYQPPCQLSPGGCELENNLLQSAETGPAQPSDYDPYGYGSFRCGNGTLSGGGYLSSANAATFDETSWSTTLSNGVGQVSGTATSLLGPDRGTTYQMNGVLDIQDNASSGCNDSPPNENAIWILTLS